jgi:hypothetical protein
LKARRLQRTPSTFGIIASYCPHASYVG